jgi:acetyl esterase/lipase
MDRRSLIGIGAVALAALPARASVRSPCAPLPDSGETIPLWPDAPPGRLNPNIEMKIVETSPNPDVFHNRQVTGVAQPVLAVFRPAAPDGSSVLILPGGGYRQLDVDMEGYDVARVMNAAGVTAFVLTYRLPSEGWQDAADVPLQDAQRAMRLIRANAAGYALDPERVGAIGFSAGGHLAASLAIRSNATVYAAQDAADALNAKPAFAALLLSRHHHAAALRTRSFAPGIAHGRHPIRLPFARPIPASGWSRREMPAMLLVDALDDDPDVAPDNTLAMFAAPESRASARRDCIIFERGGHGFGLAIGKPAGDWPDVFLRWAEARGILYGAAE